MWQYQKSLQYPINIKNPNPKLASYIISQYGGPNGELGASMRYLAQRFAMPNEVTRATLNDIGTEELVPISYQYSIPPPSSIQKKREQTLPPHNYNI